MKESDFTYRGYNKYFLWMSLFYQCLTNPRLESLAGRKQKATEIYLKILEGANE